MTGRDRTVVMVIATAAILGIFWFLVVGPRHSQYTKASSDLTAAQAELATAQQALASAQAAKRTYAADYAQIAKLGKAVPVDDEVPSLVYQLSHTADANQIDFRSIDMTSTGGSTPAPAAAAATTPTTTTSTTSTTPATGTAATAAATTPATNVTAATLPPGAELGTAGFPTMPFTFIFDGSFFNMSDFLHQLDEYTTVRKSQLKVKGRLLTINGISIAASRKGFPRIQATVSATAFLLPSDEGLTGGATSTAPAAAATTASSGATSTSTPAATATVK